MNLTEEQKFACANLYSGIVLRDVQLNFNRSGLDQEQIQEIEKIINNIGHKVLEGAPFNMTIADLIEHVVNHY